MSEVLLPFGYEYLQIDDGYQRGKRPSGAVAQHERAVPRRPRAARGLHPRQGSEARHLDQRRVRPGGLRAAARRLVPEGHLGRGSEGQLDRPPPRRVGARGARRARAANLPRRFAGWTGSTSSSTPSAPALRGLQHVPRLPRTQGCSSVRRAAVLRLERPGGSRTRPVPAGVLGRAAGVGRPGRRLPHRHRRLLLRRPRPVQLVQQRRLAQRPGSHRAERHGSVAIDDGDVADGVAVPADRQAGALPHGHRRAGAPGRPGTRDRARPAVRRGRLALVADLAGGRRGERARPEAVRRRPDAVGLPLPA